MKFNILYIFLLLIGTASFGQKGKSILFLNAYLHTGTGDVIQSASVGIRDGKFDLIKNTLTYKHDPKKWDTIIDLNGQHMYPGLVAPNSTLGLTEIDAVRATRDFDEVGELNPHIRSLIAYNVESDVIATVRSNGVLLAQVTPRGGVISGSSSLMHLDGWNWEDAAVVADDGIHVNWPSFFRSNRGAVSSQDEDKRKEAYEEHKREIRTFFEQAKSYAEMPRQEYPDLRFEAMKGIFKGDKRVYFHAEELQQLLDVIEFCQYFDFDHPVIIGGYDSYLIIPQLRDAKIPIMLPRIHSLPENEHDPVDLPYKLPSLLKEGGILFCLQNEGDMEAMNARNIPFLAGHTMGYGLSEEEALRSVSLSSCEILGIDKEYGSIEIGKKATLFVSTGPALDMRTNNVTLAMMNGIWVDLNDRQKALYEKYKEKYRKP